jgi:two-component sensor histidine kinase
MTSAAQECSDRPSHRRRIGSVAYEWGQRDQLVAELQTAHARDGALLSKMRELSQHQATVEQECGHRLINGLQMIVSLLSLQSRTAT